jgi:hypothetical protein
LTIKRVEQYKYLATYLRSIIARTSLPVVHIVIYGHCTGWAIVAFILGFRPGQGQKKHTGNYVPSYENTFFSEQKKTQKKWTNDRYSSRKLHKSFALVTVCLHLPSSPPHGPPMESRSSIIRSQSVHVSSHVQTLLVLISYHPEIHLLAVLFPIICKPISIIVLFLVYGIRPSIY